MQQALTHQPTRRPTAIVAAVIIAGALGAAAIGFDRGQESAAPGAPPASAHVDASAVATPTPYGRAQHQAPPPAAGDVLRTRYGGAHP
jgi:hypothetical protein